ncbi:MAG: hypothetical protein V1856_01970 [Candidatus Liptonbacteria bacterium]
MLLKEDKTMEMENIHPGVLVWWAEWSGVWAFVEINETSFKLFSLHDFEERTFHTAPGSRLSSYDLRLMRPCTLEEARVYTNRVTEELKGEIQKKREELEAAGKKLESYIGEAKGFIEKREAESVAQET